LQLRGIQLVISHETYESLEEFACKVLIESNGR